MGLFLVGPVSADLVAVHNPAGYLQVQSQVEGARVYFDALYKGIISNGSLTIPVNATDSQYGNIVLEYTGYQTCIAPFPKLVPGKTVSTMIEMNKAGYDNMGIIRFETAPPGVTIALNGVKKGVTPDSGVLVLYTVPTKLYYLVDFTRNGSEPQTQNIYVSSNALTMFRVIMNPAKSGEVSFNSNPAGATVYLDNKNMGITPVRIPDVPIGDHAILMRADKYQDWNGSVFVPGGGTDVVEAVLVSVPETPCPPTDTPGSVSESPAPVLPEQPAEPEQTQNTVLHLEVIIAVILILCLITGLVYLYNQKMKKE